MKLRKRDRDWIAMHQGSSYHLGTNDDLKRLYASVLKFIETLSAIVNRESKYRVVIERQSNDPDNTCSDYFLRRKQKRKPTCYRRLPMRKK